jgi:hypothetical protein
MGRRDAALPVMVWTEAPGCETLGFHKNSLVSNEDGFVSDLPQTSGGDNPAGGIAVDSSGNVYVAGSTQSTNFPTTPGAYQTTSNIVTSKYNSTPPSDLFVTKLNATGSALVYSTYLGGGGTPYQPTHGKTVTVGTFSGASDIAVDASGDAYVTGWTNSPTFPTKNPIQATLSGETNSSPNGSPTDSFVTVLNPAGSGLLFSTYLGGSSSYDFGYSIGLDSANNVYVTGETGSSNFPTTAGAYDTTSGTGFVYKIDPPVAGSNATPTIAFTPSGTTASSGSPQVHNSNGQPASSQADQLFALIGNNLGVRAAQTVLMDLSSEWQSLESTLLARFDALLSMGFNADKLIAAQDTLMRDLFFASLSAPDGV